MLPDGSSHLGLCAPQRGLRLRYLRRHLAHGQLQHGHAHAHGHGAGQQPSRGGTGECLLGSSLVSVSWRCRRAAFHYACLLRSNRELADEPGPVSRQLAQHQLRVGALPLRSHQRLGGALLHDCALGAALALALDRALRAQPPAPLAEHQQRRCTRSRPARAQTRPALASRCSTCLGGSHCSTQHGPKSDSGPLHLAGLGSWLPGSLSAAAGQLLVPRHCTRDCQLASSRCK
mmetsp:Transcript_9552/g.23660  ORF Transcript_9552/g.23660 Transcript_9552/m.23660 type:complete len:232 (-) Transcript_9552:516-1211(-)